MKEDGLQTPSSEVDPDVDFDEVPDEKLLQMNKENSSEYFDDHGMVPEKARSVTMMKMCMTVVLKVYSTGNSNREKEAENTERLRDDELTIF